MVRKIIVVPIIVIILIFTIMVSLDSSTIEKKESIFHVTLADPNLYTNGVYKDNFTIEKGNYVFRFVPNGSSPQNLSITLSGENLDFNQNYELNGASHQTGISEYYTWEYSGNKTLSILETQKILITIDPHGNVMGSVSVDIIEN